MGTATATPAIEFSPVWATRSGRDSCTCVHEDGRESQVPPFLGRHIQVGDGLARFGPTEFLIQRSVNGRKIHMLHASVGYAAQPKQSKNGEWLVRAELPTAAAAPKALLITGDALRSYFYLLDGSASLYQVLGCQSDTDAGAMRVSWRLRNLELAGTPRETSRAERAFNVLANPDLRRCYDALRADEDAPPLFPYGGFGSILVAGDLADDAFFGHRILAYRPDVRQRRFSLLLRQCEFLADRVVCRDPHRHVEASFDANLLSGFRWDLTWNQWKHWLKSRVEVDATFVYTGKYQLRDGEWILRRWLSALPSRTKARIPEAVHADVDSARAIHRLLGEHADVVERVRALIETEPVEYKLVQKWFDELGVSVQLKPQHVSWQPDYDVYYFDELGRHATTWYLFRREFLFVLPHVLVSEVPESGHATYVCAKPENMEAFLTRYATATREDIRHNRSNRGGELGFVGRVLRGRRKKRWLANLLKLAGEKADYVESLE